ncbi:hypothetical protein ACFFRR_002279 [Megaselia abdita]
MTKKQVLFVIGLLSVSIVNIHGSQDLEGCNVGTTHDDSNMRTFFFKNFENNSPKKEELLRLKLYFNGKAPAVSIAENEKQLVFGYNHKNPNQFGIYLTHEDWMSAENPCHSEMVKDTFSQEEYTEVDVVLQKDGRFFVIVYGNKGFAVSCQTNIIFSPESKILIGYAGNKGLHKFFYDCPMRNIQWKRFETALLNNIQSSLKQK